MVMLSELESLPELAIAIQIDTPLYSSETRVSHGFQRFNPSFNRTAVIARVDSVDRLAPAQESYLRHSALTRSGRASAVSPVHPDCLSVGAMIAASNQGANLFRSEFIFVTCLGLVAWRMSSATRRRAC